MNGKTAKLIRKSVAEVYTRADIKMAGDDKLAKIFRNQYRNVKAQYKTLNRNSRARFKGDLLE